MVRLTEEQAAILTIYFDTVDVLGVWPQIEEALIEAGFENPEDALVEAQDAVRNG